MIPNARATLRSVMLILLQRGAIVAGGVLFVAIVPPLMGPAVYGQYLLLTALGTWLALLGGLGITSTISRHVPSLAARESPEALRALLGNLLALRLVSGGAALGIYLGLTLFWLRDLPATALVLVAASVWVQTVGNFFFAVFLGINRPARWVAGDTLRRWLHLALVPLGFSLGGFRGACCALLGAEVVVLAVGMAWTQVGLSGRHLRPRAAILAPHLRLGLAFLGAQVLFAAFHGSGEPMVRVFTDDYREVGYFGLAHGAYLMAVGALSQVSLAFAPVLSRHLDRGATSDLQEWTARLFKGMGVLSVVGAYGGAILAEPLVSLVLGEVFRPVALNLAVLALAGVPLALGSVLGVLTVVHDRPGVSLVSSTLRLAALWGVGVLLLASWGSLGGCLAVLGGTVLHTLCLAVGLRGRVGPGLRSWLASVALGAPFLPVLWLRSTPLVEGVLGAAVILGYGAAIVLARLVTRTDLREIAAILRPLPPTPPPGDAGGRARPGAE